MLLAIGLGWAWSHTLESHRKPALFSLITGYLLFIVPTTTLNIIDPATISGIPSIMCGFAVILAFVLTLKVAPEAVVKREDRRGLSFLRGVVGE